MARPSHSKPSARPPASSARAVVFDFDGVLADSEPLHFAAAQEVFASLGLTLTREEYYSRYLGYDDEGMFSVMNEVHDLGLDRAQRVALLIRKSAIVNDLISGTDVLYPGAAECIERLARTFPLGIASGALRHEIDAILRRSRLTRHFGFIVASGDTPNSKPAPDPYARAAELHRLAPAACVAIEDSRWGIVSAKAAGLRCVGITNTYPPDELRDADTIIGNLSEFTSELIESL